MNKWIAKIMGFLQPQFGGGGGGGGSETYYENQDRLLGVQADIAQGIYNDIYQPNAPGAVSKLSGMVDEAGSGALARRVRGQAGVDAQIAAGLGLDAARRGLERFGATMNPNAMAANLTNAGLRGAALKTDAMNKAGQWAEGQKWGRAYDFYNALSGIPSQTTATLGSAAQSYGAMGRNEQESDMANARGYGQMGGAIAGGLFGRGYRRGGMVRRNFATGGLMRLPDWRSRPSNIQGRKAPSAMGSMISGAVPRVAGELLRPHLGAIKDGIAGIFKPGADAASIVTNPISAEAVVTPVAEAAAPELIGTLAPETGAATLGAEAVGAAGAEAAGAAAGLGAAVPILGLGLLAAGLFGDEFADGGAVRNDMTAGGNVSGPGGPTEDKVPAWLSDGEHVQNAHAVTMPRERTARIVRDWLAEGGTTRMLLEDINHAGLRRRGRGGGSAAARDGVPQLRGGGYLGVAMGAGVEEMNRQRMMDRYDRADKRAEEELGMRKASHAQEGVARALQIDEAKAQAKQRENARVLLEDMQNGYRKIIDGDFSPITKGIDDLYNKQAGPFSDGKTIAYQTDARGDLILNELNPDGSAGASQTLDRRAAANLYLQGKAALMKFQSPELFQAAQQAEAAALEKQRERQSREKIAAGHDATSIETTKLRERGDAARHAASMGVQLGQLDIRRKELDRAGEKWDIEKPEVEARAGDALKQREARLGLMDALEGGNAKEIEKARLKAVAAGVKFDKPNNEFTAVTDSMGLNITRTNKDTGQVDIINPKTGKVTTIPAPGTKQAVPATEVDAQAQAKAAVAAGASKSAVNARLKQLGFKELP